MTYTLDAPAARYPIRVRRHEGISTGPISEISGDPGRFDRTVGAVVSARDVRRTEYQLEPVIGERRHRGRVGAPLCLDRLGTTPTTTTTRGT